MNKHHLVGLALEKPKCFRCGRAIEGSGYISVNGKYQHLRCMLDISKRNPNPNSGDEWDLYCWLNDRCRGLETVIIHRFNRCGEDKNTYLNTRQTLDQIVQPSIEGLRTSIAKRYDDPCRHQNLSSLFPPAYRLTLDIKDIGNIKGMTIPAHDDFYLGHERIALVGCGKLLEFRGFVSEINWRVKSLRFEVTHIEDKATINFTGFEMDPQHIQWNRREA